MNNQREKQRIDNVAEWFSSYDGFNGKIIHYTGNFLSQMCQGPNVLEMGCADGLITSILANQFESITAVDGSSVLIEKAKEKLANQPNVEFIISMFESMRLDKRFDTVLQAHILEHVDNPVEIMSIGCDHLKDDGILIAEVPHAMSIHRMIGVKMGILPSVSSLSDSDIKIGHRRVYTIDALTKDAEQAGLKVIDSGGFLLKPLSNSQMDPWPKDLVDAFFRLGKEIPQYAAEIYILCKKS